MIADLDGAAAPLVPRRPRRPHDRPDRQTARRISTTGRSGIVTSFSSAGLTAFGHLLKPDVGAPGGQILSSTLPSSPAARSRSSTGRAWPRRTSPAPPRCCSSGIRPGRPQQVKSALVSTAGARLGGHRPDGRGAGADAPGCGQVDLTRRERPEAVHRPGLALVSATSNVNRGAASKALLLSLTDAGERRRHLDGRGASRSRSRAASEIAVPRRGHDRPGRQRPTSRSPRRGSSSATPRRDVRLPAPAQGLRHAQGRLRAVSCTRPRSSRRRSSSCSSSSRATRARGVSRASAYRYPAAAFGPAAELHAARP